MSGPPSQDVPGEASGSATTDHGIEYRPRVLPRWLQRAFWFLSIAGWVRVLLELVEGETQWSTVIQAVLWTGMVIVSRKDERLAFTADSTGIHAGRHFDEPWEAIEAVVEQGSFDSVTRVVMRDGSVRTCGFPPQYARDLARLGEREMVPRPTDQ